MLSLLSKLVLSETEKIFWSVEYKLIQNMCKALPCQFSAYVGASRLLNQTQLIKKILSKNRVEELSMKVPFII